MAKRKTKKKKPVATDLDGNVAAEDVQEDSPAEKKKKKREKPQIMGNTLKEFAGNANAAYGIDWVVDAADAIEAGVVRLSTGIFEVDLILRGGLPYSQALTLFGSDSTGKSVLMMIDAAATVQTCRHCYTRIIEFTNYETGETKVTCRCGKQDRMNAVVADSENRWDMVWGQTIGLPKKGDPGYDNLWIVQPSTAERLTDMLRDAIHQHLIDKLYVDSFTGLFPESQTGRTSLEQQPGSAAKAITTLISTIINQNSRQGIKGRKVTIVGSTQVRSKIGVSFGDPREMPGGWMLKHMRTCHFDFYSPKKDEGIKDDKRSAGPVTHYIDFHVKLKKASMGGGEGAEAYWRLYANQYGDNTPGNLDNAKRIINQLKTVGMAGKVKGGYQILGLEVSTVAEVAMLADDPAVYMVALYAMLLCASTPQTAAYLDLGRYDYNPFYEVQVTMPEEDDDENPFPRVELVPRDVVGKKTPSKGSGGKGKTNQDANKELAGFNPESASNAGSK